MHESDNQSNKSESLDGMNSKSINVSILPSFGSICNDDLYGKNDENQTDDNHDNCNNYEDEHMISIKQNSNVKNIELKGPELEDKVVNVIASIADSTNSSVENSNSPTDISYPQFKSISLKPIDSNLQLNSSTILNDIDKKSIISSHYYTSLDIPENSNLESHKQSELSGFHDTSISSSNGFEHTLESAFGFENSLLSLFNQNMNSLHLYNTIFHLPVVESDNLKLPSITPLVSSVTITKEPSRHIKNNYESNKAKLLSLHNNKKIDENNIHANLDDKGLPIYCNTYDGETDYSQFPTSYSISTIETKNTTKHNLNA